MRPSHGHRSECLSTRLHRGISWHKQRIEFSPSPIKIARRHHGGPPRGGQPLIATPLAHVPDADGPLPFSPPARKSSRKLMRRCLLALAHAAWPQPVSLCVQIRPKNKLESGLSCHATDKGPSLHLLDVLYPSKPRCDLLHLGSRAVEPHGPPRIPAAKLPALGPFRARLPTPDPRTAIVLS